MSSYMNRTNQFRGLAGFFMNFVTFCVARVFAFWFGPCPRTFPGDHVEIARALGR